MRKLHYLTALLILPASLSTPAVEAAQTTERRAVVFYTAEIHGILEPCGCTSDPLGDFARVTALVRASAGHNKAAILVDAGNLTYPLTTSESASLAKKQPAADLQARFIAREIAKLPFGGSALGETDLALGMAGVEPKRLAANLTSAPVIEPSRMVEVGSIKIGILGVVDPDLARGVGLVATEPVPATQLEVKRLRAAGAEVVILLAPVGRQLARNLARMVGADIVVVGKNVGDGMAKAERVGDAFLVAPAAELQRVGRLEIVLRGKERRSPLDSLVDAGGAAQAKARLAELDHDIARIEADLARWRKDTSTDPAFVEAKIRQRDELKAERARLGDGKWRPPATGSYLTNTLVPIQRTLPRDRALSASMRRLDRAIGEANLRVAEPPPPAGPERAYYVGGEKCVSCHKAAARFWQTTVHAHAWKTLVDVGKEAHDDCVSCHVTGYGEVGGSSLVYTHGLENIQCEVCHGPGSIHIDNRGKETPFAGRTKTSESVCLHCHNEKHSDTFNYTAYLRDILGPGHGEDARDKLGTGPTGKELRQAAQARLRSAAKVRAKR